MLLTHDSSEHRLMHRAVIGLLIIAASLVCSCGRSPSQATLPSPRHGGNILELPDSRGFVELMTQRGTPSKGGRGEGKSRIVAYFCQPDATTAMSPAPTDVKVTLGAAGSGTVVTLAPQSTEPGQFAAEPGNYPDELRGQIDFQLDGKPVQARFSFR
jgi:hypothetical protein